MHFTVAFYALTLGAVLAIGVAALRSSSKDR
jgi:hypothetical protein